MIVESNIENDTRCEKIVLDGAVRLGPGALISEGTSFDAPIYVADQARVLGGVTIGKYSYVGRNSIVTKASIGRYCSIAHDCRINYFREHPKTWLSTHPFQYDNGIFAFWNDYKNFEKRSFDADASQAHVTIGHDVWLGAGAMVFGGVSISNGAMVGASSMVRSDVPAYAIAFGVPAHVGKYRFDKNTIERLLKIRWWEMREEELRELPFDNVQSCLDQLLANSGG
jgi:virginiamycin A acetyltransferase